MPEIPEVEAYKEVIKAHCLKKKIVTIEITGSRVIQGLTMMAFKRNITGHAFSSVERKGKYVIIGIQSSDLKLVMHFGLTGFLLYTKDLKEKFDTSRVQFIFKDAVLHFIDARKFGKLWLLPDLNKIKGLSTLGLEPEKFSVKEFLILAQESETKNIKSFLMDQAIIAGIGNEYADEILFQAGIDPRHKIKDLSKQELLKIYKEIKSVLTYATKVRVADIKKHPKQLFFTKEDRATFKSSYLQAHRHIDMICPKNKNHSLRRIVVASRPTYYCPEDQK